MSLADELLADLDDLDGDEDEEQAHDQDNEDDRDHDCHNADANGFDDFEASMELDATDTSSGPREIAKLLYSSAFQNALQDIEKFMGVTRTSIIGPVEEDPEYKLLVKVNTLTVDIDGEVSVLHKYVRDVYHKRFPELEQLINSPVDYLRAVQMIRNDMDVTKLDLSSILSGPTVMVVTVSASNSHGQPLTPEELAHVLEACDMAFALQEALEKMLTYVESRMAFIAPNLTCIVGAATASKLIGIAGGLNALAKKPADIVQVLGATRKNLSGFSTTTMIQHTGFIYNSELVQSAPADLRRKLTRTLAGKCTLAARIDASHEATNGELGQAMRAEIEKKFEKLQEPPPPKFAKPLPRPDDPYSKRRAGKRVRRQKEKWAPTKLHKEMNRMKFGEIGDDVMQTDLGYDLGMIGQSGSGRIRGPAIDEKTKTTISKRLQRELQKSREVSGLQTGINTRIRDAGVAGTASSVAFTPVQGLEIINPNAAEKGEGTASKYFAVPTFKRVAANRPSSSK